MGEKWRQADELIRVARQRGATEAEVLVVQSSSVRVGVGERLPNRSIESQLHVRVWDESGRVGSAQSLPSGGGTDDVIGRALAALSAASGPTIPPSPRLDVPSRGMGILDPRQAGIEDEDRVQVVADALASCASRRRSASSSFLTI